VAGIVIVLLVVIVGVVVVLPKTGLLTNLFHSSGSSSSGASATTTTATTTSSSGSTAVVAATQTPVSVPQSGVYVYVDYLGGWKGTYGMPDNTLQSTNSGERIMEVENATGTVTASFWKLDSSSSRGLTVTIYKDGKVLTTGTSTAANGKVTLSVDTTTGVAQDPVVSTGSGTVAVTTTAAAAGTTVTTTASTTANVTATITTSS